MFRKFYKIIDQDRGESDLTFIHSVSSELQLTLSNKHETIMIQLSEKSCNQVC